MSDNPWRKQGRRFWAGLGSIQMIVSPYVLDNKVVLRAPRPIKMHEGFPTTFAAYKTSIWDLDTGEVHGDCRFEDVTEMHMSKSLFAALRQHMDKLDHEEQMLKP